jgi:hypothetical protein
LAPFLSVSSVPLSPASPRRSRKMRRRGTCSSPSVSTGGSGGRLERSSPGCAARSYSPSTTDRAATNATPEETSDTSSSTTLL